MALSEDPTRPGRVTWPRLVQWRARPTTMEPRVELMVEGECRTSWRPRKYGRLGGDRDRTKLCTGGEGVTEVEWYEEREV